MFACSAHVNCTIPDNYTVSFDADPDIDGIGVIAAFYIAALATVIILTVTYFSSSPEEFDNFGFSKLDVLIVNSFQRWIHPRARPKTTQALQKAILILSDQQLITGVSISIVSLARLCKVTQYHFNIAINLSLAASIAHSMTFSFVEQYVKQNIFFRTWRAIAMIIFGALILVIWIVTGSNDWLEVYGQPALCGYKNLGQNFGPPAATSLAILYWFLLREWVLAVTVLIPSFTKAGWMLTLLSTTFWLAQLCDLLQKACKKSASQLYRHHKLLRETSIFPTSSDLSFDARRLQFLSTLRAKIVQGIWSFLCGALLSSFVLLYGVAQVWGSFAFNLCWASYNLLESVKIIASLRDVAQENGMNGSENEWSFGQQLPLLMLLLPTFAMLEIFFDDPGVEDTNGFDNAFETSRNTTSSCKSPEFQMKLLPSSTFSKVTGSDDCLPEGYALRRRIDTEQRIGMDISDIRIESSLHSHQPTILEQRSGGQAINATDDQEQEPNTSFILWQIKIQKLRAARVRFAASWQALPQVIIVLLFIVIPVYLAVLYNRSTQLNIEFVTSLLASIVAAAGLSVLLFFEQRKSVIPSDLATYYLVASTLCDVLLLTIPLGISTDIKIATPVIMRLVAFLAILLLENWSRRFAISTLSRSLSPEERSGVLSKVFFFWVNPILHQGYKGILVGHDLPPLSDRLAPKISRKRILSAWGQRSKPETKWTLPYTLYQSIKQPFLAAILPRLFLTASRYSQPILMRKSIRYVTTSRASDERPVGYWIIVAAVAVYGGLAISTGIYQHRLNRLKLLTNSALTGLIHHKVMETPSVLYDNGEAVALMSSDVDGLEGIAEMFHETWAQALEVAIGVALLASEVGWFSVLPLFLIFLCSRVSRYVAKNLQSYQKNWNIATQTRIGTTSSMIASMKVVKMLGLQRYLACRTQKLRVEELEVASKVRLMMVYYNSSANALGIFSPAITLVCFAAVVAVKGQRLDAETAFTTMAVLSMVTHPANMVMTFIPRAIAAFSGFERIQNYLLRPSVKDQRQLLSQTTLRNSSLNPSSEPRPAILIQQLTIVDKQPILENINLKISAGSLTIISGPVGCGKSMLLRAVLGEIAPFQGSIMLASKRIAYCAQRPWLPGGTIKEAIISNTRHEDVHWYREVLSACCLDYDLESLPEADETQIGSRGANLSGGQKQRVALARAVFARCDIVLLDDTFSALDGETEREVFENLCSSQGIFKKLKTTVILVSNSTQYYPAADNIVILGDLGIKAQGGWNTIKSKTEAIEKFGPRNPTEEGGDSALAKNLDKLNAQLRASNEAEGDLARQTGDTTLYGYYFHFVGWINLLLIPASTASYSAFNTIPQYWLKLWTDSGVNDMVFYITGFVIMAFIAWSSTSGTMWAAQVRLAPQSGIRLHEHLLRIVTWFSQDIQLIDKQLPTALSNLSAQICKLLAQTIVLFITQKWLVLSFPACIAVVYIVQRVYLRTSRQLRFLELESRAAVFSSILETVEGLETIRSFGWRQETVLRNTQSLESSQRPEFLLLALQRWLNLVLDLLAAAIAIIVISIAVIWRGTASGGQIGVALNILLITNTTLLRLVQSWTNLEVSMGAISRLRMLEQNTPSENKSSENFEPPSNWPSSGSIKLTNVAASYYPGAVALRNINLDIHPGQRIIVCGRTGSGKSSLLLTLLRMLELESGKIEVDGVDISQVPRDSIRERCFVAVAQDPLILSNETLRNNLDPGHLEPDIVLVDALIKTGLQSHFRSGHFNGDLSSLISGLSDSDSHSFLDMEVSQFPALSGGQSQMFALARALVKVKSLRNVGLQPVVLLDEVSSSVDLTTESTIHKVIAEEFTDNGHTVVIVAHRINVLADYAKPGKDIIAWMGDGRIQEVITSVTPAVLKGLSQQNNI
ncbi:hypothetical protein B7463_g9807, partial [Scytalidium lignicola]